jgi:hypothetical protein
MFVNYSPYFSSGLMYLTVLLLIVTLSQYSISGRTRVYCLAHYKMVGAPHPPPRDRHSSVTDHSRVSTGKLASNTVLSVPFHVPILFSHLP